MLPAPPRPEDWKCDDMFWFVLVLCAQLEVVCGSVIISGSRSVVENWARNDDAL
jgi:hypothetical protein